MSGVHICMYVWSSHIAEWASTGMVASPARGQLNKENEISLSRFAPENILSRDRFDRPVPHQPAHPAHLRLYLVLAHGIPLLPLAFRDGIHPYRQPPSGQPRVYRVTQLRTDGVCRQESAGTGPV